MNKKLQLGFIGGGINSAVGTTHQIASQMDGRWVLKAGCFSRDSAVNQKTAESWHIDTSRLYTTVEQLLEKEKGFLDAIVILTPTPNHAEQVIKAIESGFSVICEKSLASSAQDARRINQVVKKHDAFLGVIYNYTGYPMLRELQLLIKKGELGRLHQIHIEMPQEGFEKLDKDGNIIVPQGWRLKDEMIPVISLDLGVHLVHMVEFLSQEKPLEVNAMQSSYGNFKGIIDNVMAMVKYSNNLTCQIWYSKTALGQSNGLKVRVYGEKGSAEWYQMEPEYLIFNDQSGDKKVITRSSKIAEESTKLYYNRFKAGHPSGFIEAFANYYYDLADALIEYRDTGETNSPWFFNSLDAEAGLCMLEAISQSAGKNAWVQVKNIG